MTSTHEFIANIGVASISTNVPFLVIFLLHRSQFQVAWGITRRHSKCTWRVHNLQEKWEEPLVYVIIIVMLLVLKLISHCLWDLIFGFWMLQAGNVENAVSFCCSSGWYGVFLFLNRLLLLIETCNLGLFLLVPIFQINLNTCKAQLCVLYFPCKSNLFNSKYSLSHT